MRRRLSYCFGTWIIPNVLESSPISRHALFPRNADEGAATYTQPHSRAEPQIDLPLAVAELRNISDSERAVTNRKSYAEQIAWIEEKISNLP